MNELSKRGLTGLVYVAVTILCVGLHQYSGFLFLLLLSMFIQTEFLSLTTTLSKKVRFSYVILGALVYIYTILRMDEAFLSDLYSFIFLSSVVAAFLLLVFLVQEDFIKNISNLLLSFVYIPVSLGLFFRSSLFSFTPVRDVLMPYEFWHILLVFIFVWSSDTFAYLIGRKLGKHKIAPRISPNKTWEGFVGGLLGSLVVAWVLFALSEPLPLRVMLLLAAVASVFGFMGDLLESRMKRSLGVKDSGNILPGHGGFLDRFDSLLVAGPVTYILLSILYLL
jgi:phosphatidate cytidylyltransferase